MLLNVISFNNSLNVFQVNWCESQIANFQKISYSDFLGITPEIFLGSSILIGFILIGLSNFAPNIFLFEQKKHITPVLCKFVEISLI
jgi:hypothetical protein